MSYHYLQCVPFASPHPPPISFACISEAWNQQSQSQKRENQSKAVDALLEKMKKKYDLPTQQEAPSEQKEEKTTTKPPTSKKKKPDRTHCCDFRLYTMSFSLTVFARVLSVAEVQRIFAELEGSRSCGNSSARRFGSDRKRGLCCFFEGAFCAALLSCFCGFCLTGG